MPTSSSQHVSASGINNHPGLGHQGDQTIVARSTNGGGNFSSVDAGAAQPHIISVQPSSLDGVEALRHGIIQHIMRFYGGSMTRLVARVRCKSDHNKRELQTHAFSFDANVDQLGWEVVLELDSTECICRRVAAIMEVENGATWEEASVIELLPSTEVLPLPSSLRSNMVRAARTARWRSRQNKVHTDESDGATSDDSESDFGGSGTDCSQDSDPESSSGEDSVSSDGWETVSDSDSHSDSDSGF